MVRIGLFPLARVFELKLCPTGSVGYVGWFCLKSESGLVLCPWLWPMCLVGFLAILFLIFARDLTWAFQYHQCMSRAVDELIRVPFC
jgi:hypothetical protein